jgi:hypothetical protein
MILYLGKEESPFKDEKCTKAEMEEQHVWFCAKTPSLSSGEGKRVRLQDDFIPWKRGVCI